MIDLLNLQNLLFDGLRLGAGANIQIEFKNTPEHPLKTATVKGKQKAAEVLPLFTTKDTIVGDVSASITHSGKPSKQTLRNSIQITAMIVEAWEMYHVNQASLLR